MTDARARGAGRSGRPPRARTWRERVEDPDEPLFTVGVAADLLGIDTQTLRRLEDAVDHNSARPSGNQRRYSRNGLAVLDEALRLAREGYPPQAITRIRQLEVEVAVLRRNRPG